MCAHFTRTYVFTYTLLLRLPNEILMGDVGSAGAGWLGVGGGVGTVTAASCSLGHLCHSGSQGDNPALI